MRYGLPSQHFKEAITMSLSKSKKARMKLLRQGGLTPDALRGSWKGVNPTTRRTATLQEKQAKLQSKHRRNHAGYSDDSFCIYRKLTRHIGPFEFR